MVPNFFCAFSLAAFPPAAALQRRRGVQGLLAEFEMGKHKSHKVDGGAGRSFSRISSLFLQKPKFFFSSFF